MNANPISAATAERIGRILAEETGHEENCVLIIWTNDVGPSAVREINAIGNVDPSDRMYFAQQYVESLASRS